MVYLNKILDYIFDSNYDNNLINSKQFDHELICAFESISCNPCISEKLIEKYNILPWDYHELSLNNLLSMKFFEGSSNEDWKDTNIFLNINFTPEYKNKYPEIEFDSEALCGNPNFKLEDLQPLDEYSIIGLINNYNINIHEYMKIYTDENNDDINYVYENDGLQPDNRTFNFIVENMDKYNFDMDYIMNRNQIEIDFNIIEKYFPSYLTKSYMYRYLDLYTNQGLTWNIIKKYPNIWNYEYLSRNMNITPEIIRNNLDIPWDFKNISDNYSLDIEFIREYKDILDFTNLSCNPCVDLDMIESNLDLPWDFKSVIENPNITLEFYLKYCEQLIEDKTFNELFDLICNEQCYHEYYTTKIHKKKIIKKFLLNCWKEYIDVMFLKN
jgi:hypothetical protein